MFRLLVRIQNWVRESRLEFLLLLGILLLAAVLRFWRLDEYLPFLGDEGRDVRVVRRFLTEFDLMFVGPRTSIGDMYLGPLYYYLIAPFLLLWRFSPVGPAAFVAFLGVVTVWLVWFVGREWFGKVAGLTGAFLFAISPIVVQLSKHSWNPNIMPFFSLLVVYSIWRVWVKSQYWWLVVVGVSFAFVLQSHYLGLLLLPTVGLVWLVTGYAIRKTQDVGRFVRLSFFGFVSFVFLMSPLFIFDAKHGWRNFGSMVNFFSERQTTVSAKPWNALPQLWPIWNEHVVTRLLVAKDVEVGVWVAAGLVLGGFFLVTRWVLLRGSSWLKLSCRNRGAPSVGSPAVSRPSYLQSPVVLVLVWILVGLVGLGLYKQHVYDHYFGFMFAAPFLLAGFIFQELWNKRMQWLVVALMIGLAWVNLRDNPLKYPPQRQMQRVQEIDRLIIEEADGEPFNFGLIAERNYEEGYLYFFELWGAPVYEIDSQKYNETLTKQLFVVCEDSPAKDNPEPCKPINHRKAEIANFGWAKIESEEEVAGVKLFKLVHTE